jgi:hypothetical protein
MGKIQIQTREYFQGKHIITYSPWSKFWLWVFPTVKFYDAEEDMEIHAKFVGERIYITKMFPRKCLCLYCGKQLPLGENFLCSDCRYKKEQGDKKDSDAGGYKWRN